MEKHILLQTIRPIYNIIPFADINRIGKRLYLYKNGSLIATIIGEESKIEVIWRIIKHDRILWRLSDSDYTELTPILREYSKMTSEDDE